MIEKVVELLSAPRTGLLASLLSACLAPDAPCVLQLRRIPVLERRTSVDVLNVRYGSLADILTGPRHVRFTPNNGRWATHPGQHLAVGL
jgi:hypothetical protein